MKNGVSKDKLILISPILPILLFSGLLIFSRGLLSFELGGSSNFVVLLGFLTPSILFRKKKISTYLPWPPYFSALAIFISYSIISASFAVPPVRGIVGLNLLIFYYVFIVMLLLLDIRREHFNTALSIVMHILSMYLIVGALIEISIDKPLSNFRQYWNPPNLAKIYAPFRISSTIGSTLPFGVVIAYLAIYWLNQFIYRYRLYALAYLLGLVFCIFGTYSRGAQVMLGCGAIASLFIRCIIGREQTNFGSLRLNGLFQFIVVVFSSISALFMLLPSSIVARLVAVFNWTSEKSNVNRMSNWMSSLNSFESTKDWVFGKTVGASGNALKYFGIKPELANSVSESYILKILTELGLVGVFIFSSFFLIFITFTLREFFTLKKHSERAVVAFSISAIFAHFIELFVLQSLESTSVAFIFLVTLYAGYKNSIHEVNQCKISRSI
jgi:hypothetical protein